MSVVNSIEAWHKAARPQPTDKNFQVQLGCHLEEVAEMLTCLVGANSAAGYELQIVREAVEQLAEGLKQGAVNLVLPDPNRMAFLDSLADQVVTAVGVGHCAYMSMPEALTRVDTSNWSKFVDGKPVFNEHGKITKPATYQPPNLEGLY